MKDKAVLKGSYYSSFFDFRLFKKNHCCNCGNELIVSTVRYKRIVDYLLYYSVEHHKDYFYHCQKCNYYIKYKNQKKILKQQIEKGSLKLTDARKLISEYKEKFVKVDKELVLEDYWLKYKEVEMLISAYK